MEPSCQSRSNHVRSVRGSVVPSSDSSSYEGVFLGADVGGIQRQVGRAQMAVGNGVGWAVVAVELTSQLGGEPAGAGAGSPRFPSACRLVVAWACAGPGGEVTDGREHGHVEAALGDQNLRGVGLDAGDRAQQLDDVLVRGEHDLDPRAEVLQRRVEGVDVREKPLHDRASRRHSRSVAKRTKPHRRRSGRNRSSTTGFSFLKGGRQAGPERCRTNPGARRFVVAGSQGMDQRGGVWSRKRLHRGRRRNPGASRFFVGTSQGTKPRPGAWPRSVLRGDVSRPASVLRRGWARLPRPALVTTSQSCAFLRQPLWGRFLDQALPRRSIPREPTTTNRRAPGCVRQRLVGADAVPG